MYSDLTKDDPENVTLLWLHVVYENMHDNHQILYKLSQQCSDLFDISEACEATEVCECLQHPQTAEMIVWYFTLKALLFGCL